MAKYGTRSSCGVGDQGIIRPLNEFWNYPPSLLVETSICNKESVLSNQGAVIVNTGIFTGRSPNDKYIVQSSPEDNSSLINWGKINQPIAKTTYKSIRNKVRAYLEGKDVFIQDMQAGLGKTSSLKIRIITEKAWASLFAYDLFVRLDKDQLLAHIPDYTVIHCPDFQVSPKEDQTKSPTAIILNFIDKEILICGTSYAGEIKKAIFTVMNYELPKQGILSMHCSANQGDAGDVALFFGLSGTGKTTLSSDPDRRLIGDDEHGWNDDGIFNFEGGCYAKTIRLKEELEPLIWKAVNSFGAVLENVDYDPVTRQINFDSDKYTENTRGAYPLDFIPFHVPERKGNHPKNIFFLSADAFGVLPPIARLNADQAVFYFLSGYTSKLAGTEKGLGIEPQATFSSCFGAPFLPMHPSVYASLLIDRIRKYKTNVWLINTGWSGGVYGIGQRIKLPITRALIRSAINDQLENVPMHEDAIFRLMVPDFCPGVPVEILRPRTQWRDPDAYDRQARLLVEKFKENIREYIECVPDLLDTLNIF
jgi:phosphoenolpyruvate carboxykinase (ATP)